MTNSSRWGKSRTSSESWHTLTTTLTASDDARAGVSQRHQPSLISKSARSLVVNNSACSRHLADSFSAKSAPGYLDCTPGGVIVSPSVIPCAAACFHKHQKSSRTLFRLMSAVQIQRQSVPVNSIQSAQTDEGIGLVKIMLRCAKNREKALSQPMPY